MLYRLIITDILVRWIEKWRAPILDWNLVQQFGFRRMSNSVGKVFNLLKIITHDDYHELSEWSGLNQLIKIYESNDIIRTFGTITREQRTNGWEGWEGRRRVSSTVRIDTGMKAFFLRDVKRMQKKKETGGLRFLATSSYNSLGDTPFSQISSLSVVLCHTYVSFCTPFLICPSC